MNAEYCLILNNSFIVLLFEILLLYDKQEDLTLGKV